MKTKDKKTLGEVVSNLIYISNVLEMTHYRREDRKSVAQIIEAQKHLSRCIEALKLSKRSLDTAEYNAQREQQILDYEEEVRQKDRERAQRDLDGLQAY